MGRTFTKGEYGCLIKQPTVMEVCEEYPFLRRLSIVSYLLRCTVDGETKRTSAFMSSCMHLALWCIDLLITCTQKFQGF